MINMIDEKDPRQESGKTDSSDDEVIIDLTEEVVVKSQKDDGILELSEDMAGDVQKIAAQDRTSEAEEDEEILDLDEIDPLGPQEEDAVVDLREPVGEERDDIAEDQLIASAIIDSFGDEDENESVTEEFDLTDFDDDQIILDDARDGADENLSDLADDETGLNQSEEDVFDLEEEIEIEYEMDDDEDELIVLEDQHAENNPEFARQVLEASGAPDQHDDRPTEFLELETENQDDFVATDNRPGDDTETAVFAADEEPELVAGDDLPDLEAVSEFDFEEEAVESRLTIEDQEADSGDDIIARAVEHSLGADDRSEQINRVADPEFALEDEEDEEDVLNLEDSPDDGQEYAVLMDDEPLKFEDDEDLLDLDEGSDLEDDDEVIPLDGFNNLEAEDDEDIIEITEFDQHFPEDAESLLKQSGFLNTSSADEEDFLELIDLEEDRLAEGEQAVTTGDPAENVASVRLDQIFKEDLEADESPIATPDTVFDDDLEDNLLGNELIGPVSDAPEIESGLEDEVGQGAADAPDADTNRFAPDERFGLALDSGAIARQVDRLDAFLSEDSADGLTAVPGPADQAAAAGAGQPESPDELEMAEPLAVPAGQLDAAIERVINEKFSGKIENIIYEVIEKAVAKEIDRLKGVLMGNHMIDDTRD